MFNMLKSFIMLKSKSLNLLVIVAFSELILQNVETLPSPNEAVKVQVNTSKTITVNKTQTVKFVSVKDNQPGKPGESEGIGETGNVADCFSSGIPPLTKTEEEFAEKLLQELTYIPFASTNTFNVFSLIIKGEAMGVVDVSKLCISRVWNLEKHELNIFGLGYIGALKCNANPVSAHSINCKSKGDNSVSLKMVRALTDGQNYLLIVGCLSHGEKFWYAVSEKFSLDAETREAILKKIEQLGFQRSEALEPSYKDCPEYPGGESKSVPQIDDDWTFVSADGGQEKKKFQFLTASTSSEEKKSEMSQCFKFDEKVVGAEFMMKMMTHHCYVPMASREYFNQVSLLLSGRELQDNKLDEACLQRSRVTVGGKMRFSITVFGFRNKAHLQCKPASRGDYRGVTCKNKGFHAFSVNIRPVYTDSSKFILAVGCFGTGKRFWAVVSTENHVDSSHKTEIFKRLAEYGFTDEGVELSYKHCGLKEAENSEEMIGPGESCFTGSSQLTQRDIKFVNTLAQIEVYIPMGSSGFFDMLSHVLTGEPLEDQDIDKACFRRTWNKEFTAVTLRGFKNQVVLKCESVESGGIIQRISCRTLGSPSGSFQVVPVYTDRERFIVAAGCNDDQKFWFVASNENHIDSYAKKSIHIALANLGFSTDAVEINYHHCEKKNTFEQESSEENLGSGEHAHCFNPSSSLSDGDTKFIRSLSHKSIYIPLANSVFYNTMSYLLSDRPLEENDADGFCLGRKWNKDLTELKFQGFGTERLLTCKHFESGLSVMCKPYADTTYSAQFNPIHTDAKHYTLVVGCLQDGQKFWFVASTEDHVDNLARHSIQIKLASLGFSSDERALSYHHCEKDKEHEDEDSTKELESVSSGEASKEIGQCPELTNSANITLTRKELLFVKNLRLKTTYNSIGSPELYDAFSHILTGKPLEENDIDKACLTRKVNLQTGELTIRGFGTSTVLNCKLKLKNKQPGVHCTSKIYPEFGIRVAVVFTDGRTYALGVGCLSDGEKIWAVASLHDHVDSSSRRDIAIQLAALGFPHKEGLHINYKHCKSVSVESLSSESESGSDESSEEKGHNKGKKEESSSESESGSDESSEEKDKKDNKKKKDEKKSKEELSSESESGSDESSEEKGHTKKSGVPEKLDEGRCIEPAQTVDNSQRDKIMRALGEGAYVPLANKHSYYAYSMLLRDSPLKEDGDLKDVCVMTVWLNTSLSIFGFGTYKAGLDCETANLGNIKCTPNLAKMDNKKAKIYAARYSIVWADDHNFLSVNCLSNGKKTWVLLSSKKTVSSTVKELVLKKIAELGFDKENARELPYDNCDV